MTAYLVANNHLTGFESNIAAYRAGVTEVSTAAGGRYLARGEPIKVLEGQWLPRQRNVISAWPDAATIERFWNSDAYAKKLKPHRAGNALNDIAIFQGENDPPPPGGTDVYMLVLAQLTRASAGYGQAVSALLPKSAPDPAVATSEVDTQPFSASSSPVAVAAAARMSRELPGNWSQ